MLSDADDVMINKLLRTIYDEDYDVFICSIRTKNAQNIPKM